MDRLLKTSSFWNCFSCFVLHKWEAIYLSGISFTVFGFEQPIVFIVVYLPFIFKLVINIHHCSLGRYVFHPMKKNKQKFARFLWVKRHFFYTTYNDSEYCEVWFDFFYRRKYLHVTWWAFWRKNNMWVLQESTEP